MTEIFPFLLSEPIIPVFQLSNIPAICLTTGNGRKLCWPRPFYVYLLSF
jgi:hypothetical protein